MHINVCRYPVGLRYREKAQTIRMICGRQGVRIRRRLGFVAGGHSHVRRYRRRMGLTAIRPHTRSFMSVRCAGDDLCIQSGLRERFSGSLARYVPRDGSRANLSCVFVFATGSRPAVCQEGKSLRRIVDDLRKPHIDLNEDRFRPASGHGFCYHVSILQANHMIGFPAGHDSIEWVSRTRIDTPQAVSVFAAVAVSSADCGKIGRGQVAGFGFPGMAPSHVAVMGYAIL